MDQHRFDADPDTHLDRHQMEIRIRVGIKTMTIHNTGQYLDMHQPQKHESNRIVDLQKQFSGRLRSTTLLNAFQINLNNSCDNRLSYERRSNL